MRGRRRRIEADREGGESDDDGAEDRAGQEEVGEEERHRL